MSSNVLKENENVEEMKFRHKSNTIFLDIMIMLAMFVFVCTAIVQVFNSDNVTYLNVACIPGVIVILGVFIQEIVRASNYTLEVKENKLIYNHGSVTRCIQLPCLITQTQKGVISSNGNSITECKIKFGGLEFDASDTDTNGKMIGEFLGEANQKAFRASPKDSVT